MGGNVTSAGLQVTLRDPMWHGSSCSGEAGLLTKGEPLQRVYSTYFTLRKGLLLVLFKLAVTVHQCLNGRASRSPVLTRGGICVPPTVTYLPW